MEKVLHAATNSLATGIGLISIHSSDGTTFEVVPFRYGNMGLPVGIILGDRLLLATDVPYILLLMQEEICKGMRGRAVVSLLVTKLETMEAVVVRNIIVVGRTNVLLYVETEDEPHAITLVAINVAQVQRSEVSTTKLKGKTFPKS